ncbi:phage tail tape measure protein [Prescottella equi]|uniref:phage tail tape measure protein n=1 Tax=Rhodococcus hoagii TaxID=43767 RepID=UPI000A1148B4|nr:phage tail tape measure protein [Prescottella equi]ORL30462.1 hypothetical protein A6I91_21225 [Prescottella equi]
METIGWAALQVIPTMQGVEGSMSGQLVGPMRTAGKRAGQAAGDGIAAGIAGAKAAVEKATSDLSKSQDKVADAAGKRRVAEAALVELQEKGITSGARHTRAVEALESAKRKEAAASKVAEQATKNLADAEERAAKAAEGGADDVSRFAGSFDGFGDKIKGGVSDLGKFTAAAAGIGSAIGLGMAAMDNMDIESKLAAQLGATGDLAAEYGDRAGALYRSGVAGSMEEAAQAVGLVANSFRTAGFEGEASMDQIASNAMTFANVFDQDVSASVQTASQLIQNGLAKDSTEAFDLLTRSFQTVPAAMRDELPEIIQEYGTNFRALGFDGEESFNLLVAAAEQGKFALDKTGDALKEFTIRATDGSKSTAEAYKFLGEDAEAMATSVAAGGESAQLALQYTAQKLLDIEDPAVMAQQAIALFGTPLEDLSVDQIPAFLKTLTGAEDAMSGFAGSTQQMSDTVNSGPNHAMTVLKNTIQSTITDGIGAAAQFLIENADLWAQIGSVVTDIGSVALPVVWGAMQIGIGILGDVANAIGGVVGWFREHEVVAGILVGVITIGLLPALVSMTVGFATSAAGAVASGATLTAVWVSTQASAVASAAAQVAAQYRTVAGWVASSAAAVANGAIMVGQWIAAGATATAQAAIAAGAWVASSARTIGALALQGAAFIAHRAVMIAGAVATGAATAAQWAFNLALSANPITLIIIAVTALVAGLIWFFTQTEIGKKIITAAWDAILTGWNWMYDKVSAGIDAFGAALGWIGQKAGEAKDWVVQKFNDLVGFVTGLPGRISSAASGLWDGIINAFRSALNWIIQKWNNFRLSWEFTVPVINKKVSLSLDTPDLPLFRDGGVIAGRTEDGQLWGPGTGRSDSIVGVDAFGVPVVRVADGEGIVREDVMRQGGAAVVAALNAGWVPPAGFLHALMNGDFQSNPFGIEEDSRLVAGAFGLRSLAIDGDYTPNMFEAFGVEEDHPVISGLLSLRDAMSRLPKFAEGGVIGSLTSLASEHFPALQVTDTVRPGANDYHGAGKAVDFSNGSGNTDEQLGFANFLADNYQGQLLELIYDDPRFDRQIKNGEIVPRTYYANAGDHTHHVHAAADEPLGPPAPPAPEHIQVGSGPSGAVPSWGPDVGAPSATSTSTPTTELQQTFSARDRWKSMFTDIAGVWSDASIEILGVGEYLDLADRYTIKADSTAGMSSPSSIPSSPQSAVGADQLATVTEGLIDPNAPVQTGPGDRTGAELYAYEIARAASEMGLGEAAAVIGEATALVEVGDPLKMYANSKLPASLALPHDAVGNDGTSTGLFQQQDYPEWGTLEQRMNPFESARMFFEHLTEFDWKSMDPGAAAQKVQRSAFPGRYSQMMTRGQELVDETGLFDTGGWMMPGQLGFNGLNEPEPVLLPRHWDIAEANIDKVDELVGAGVSGGPRVQINNNQQITIADQASWQRDQAMRQSIALMRFGGGRA